MIRNIINKFENMTSVQWLILSIAIVIFMIAMILVKIVKNN